MIVATHSFRVTLCHPETFLFKVGGNSEVYLIADSGIGRGFAAGQNYLHRSGSYHCGYYQEKQHQEEHNVVQRRCINLCVTWLSSFNFHFCNVLVSNYFLPPPRSILTKSFEYLSILATILSIRPLSR